MNEGGKNQGLFMPHLTSQLNLKGQPGKASHTKVQRHSKNWSWLPCQGFFSWTMLTRKIKIICSLNRYLCSANSMLGAGMRCEKREKKKVSVWRLQWESIVTWEKGQDAAEKSNAKVFKETDSTQGCSSLQEEPVPLPGGGGAGRYTSKKLIHQDDVSD